MNNDQDINNITNGTMKGEWDDEEELQILLNHIQDDIPEEAEPLSYIPNKQLYDSLVLDFNDFPEKQKKSFIDDMIEDFVNASKNK